MDVFIGRQPILDKSGRIVAYELLYRSGPKNEFPDIDSEKATSYLINHLFTSFGLSEVSNNRPVFINFGKNMLLSGLPQFDPKAVVIELLEGLKIDEGLINACRNLHRNGFKIALDDFILEKEILPLIKISSIIKIDWLRDSIDKIRELLKALKGYHGALLAEKIETHEQFEISKEMGFHLFQGYFFARPKILKKKGLSSNELTKMKLLRLFKRDEWDIKEMAEILKSDVSIVGKLLNLINSAKFSLQRNVATIEEAIIIIGISELKKWLTIILFSETSSNIHYKEILDIAILRACFCEEITKIIDFHLKDKAYLTGLVSFFHILLERELQRLISDLPLEDSIKEAVLYERGILGKIFSLSKAYERFDTNRVFSLSKDLGISKKDLATSFVKAVERTNRYCNF